MADPVAATKGAIGSVWSTVSSVAKPVGLFLLAGTLVTAATGGLAPAFAASVGGLQHGAQLLGGALGVGGGAAGSAATTVATNGLVL